MLSLHDISLAWQGRDILRRIQFDVETGEILCLLGASGCGKTTLLRVIAGLEGQFSGDIYLNGQSILGQRIHEREFGLMFQDFALFPHLNVYENVAFGLKMRGLGHSERQTRVQEVLQLVGLEQWSQRDVATLSGGEKQRVALARSLAPKPRLLMLDEPLGSLDANLRQQLGKELRETIKRAGLTAIYVTHDQQEAFAIADRIAVMNAGQIEQIDTPQHIYDAPKSRYVAEFLGLSNVFDVLSHVGNRASTAIGHVPLEASARWVCVHPKAITLRADGDQIGTLIERQFLGRHYGVVLQVHDGQLTFSVPSEHLTATVGEKVPFSLDPSFILPLAK